MICGYPFQCKFLVCGRTVLRCSKRYQGGYNFSVAGAEPVLCMSFSLFFHNYFDE